MSGQENNSSIKVSGGQIDRQTVVVKLGTSVLTGGSKKLDRAHMVELVRQCAMLIRQGHHVVIVTSGAIAAGREHLNHPQIANTIANKQMLAAVGQSRIIQAWESLFAIYGINIGQMLLTRADLDDRERYLNARDMLQALLDNNIVPVVNENDAVATAEIKVGDNDNLSALVAILAEADKLLLLTDQPGLFTADPRSNPDAELIHEVHTIDETLHKLAGGSVSGLGTGGMATKLQAADVARRAGIEVTIAAGSRPEVIQHVVEGKPAGTRFLPLESPLESRKRWILAGPPPAGNIVIDDGAAKAVVERHSSLLSKGIVSVDGQFDRGAVARICNKDGKLLARGICRYSSKDLSAIAGRHSQDIQDILGYAHGAVAVHCDDLVVID
ncbi:glutamate 5-kinase [Enterovibrio nigricans]|uniref:Glutamate 5-kinase n=1 Tax=Enterovibrio nigricans DSM 22720 TaxID=1121868 RepID=A0A1T4U3T8_9GAMM|nr:glutamate 5-kinase [Enterovibrio nigricans]SKA47188.1 glutamate 5-kinase [Enterovibrio nigricans DSM 22720]